jgi:uncharacterized membrane protein YdbT with pleckstrin-like domain
MVTLDKDEHILFEVRKHWFVLATEIFWGFVALVVPIIIFSIASSLPVVFQTSGNAIMLFLFLYTAWLLVVWMIMFVLWTEFYLDVWIVTNKRLIDIEQHGLFSREISTMQLTKIQDVTSEQHGIISTFMNFGELRVQTAGVEKEFVIKNVIDPNTLRKKLDDALSKIRNKESF